MRSVADDAPGTASVGDMRLSGRRLRQAEIEKDDVILVSEFEILRLDVAMDDRRLVGVQIRKRVEKLISLEHDPADRKRFLRDLEALR